VKVWYGYGSEHSANLVMIGHFQEIGDAEQAQRTMARLTEGVEADIEEGRMELGGKTDRYSDEILRLLSELSVVSLAPSELEQFAYDVDIRVEDSDVILGTEEIDVSAFIKVLINAGARVEVYSAHDYPGMGHGRGERA